MGADLDGWYKGLRSCYPEATTSILHDGFFSGTCSRGKGVDGIREETTMRGRVSPSLCQQLAGLPLLEFSPTSVVLDAKPRTVRTRPRSRWMAAEGQQELARSKENDVTAGN